MLNTHSCSICSKPSFSRYIRNMCFPILVSNSSAAASFQLAVLLISWLFLTVPLPVRCPKDPGALDLGASFFPFRAPTRWAIFSLSSLAFSIPMGLSAKDTYQLLFPCLSWLFLAIAYSPKASALNSHLELLGTHSQRPAWVSLLLFPNRPLRFYDNSLTSIQINHLALGELD